MFIWTAFRISTPARLLPLHRTSCRSGFLDIRCGATADQIRTFDAFSLDSVLIIRVLRTKQGIDSFLILDLTAPRPCTLKNYILPCSNLMAFAGVWKHRHPVPSTFTHCLHSPGPLLPSIFHD
jgi:hypothetical protein